MPKLREVGFKPTGDTPVPLSCAVWEEVEPLSFTVKVPVRAPSTVGVKVTETLQVAPAPSVLGAIGQVEVSAKSPETVMLLIVSGVVRVLVSFTV